MLSFLALTGNGLSVDQINFHVTDSAQKFKQMSIPSHSRRPSTSSQMAATEPQQRRRRMALETIQQVLQYMNTLSLVGSSLLLS